LEAYGGVLGEKPLQVLVRASAGEIIEDGHIPTQGSKMEGRVDTDEAGAASDQDRRHRSVTKEGGEGDLDRIRSDILIVKSRRA
jgi:hypothetical protein